MKKQLSTKKIEKFEDLKLNNLRYIVGGTKAGNKKKAGSKGVAGREGAAGAD